MRALAIARQMKSEVTLIGSRLPEGPFPAHVKTLLLPADTAPGMQVESFDALHYAPLAVAGLRERMGLIADWIRQAWPCVLVVDVSVEIAMLARLFGVPCVYMRQHGERNDPAHLQAYASASMLLAPYPQAMECSHAPDWVLAKTRYSGWISRYAGRAPQSRASGSDVLIITGQGGTAFTAESIAAIARTSPHLQFRVAGLLEGITAQMPTNLQLLGHLADPSGEYARASIVIGSAGDNVLAEVANLGCRFIAVAEQRPFDEQRLQAQQLQALGVAVGVAKVPAPQQWPALLEAARRLPGASAWQPLLAHDATNRAAHSIEQTLQSHFSDPAQ